MKPFTNAKFLYTFFAATLVALTLRLFFIEDYRIISNSMFPSLEKGDLVFVSKATYGLKVPFTSFELFQFQPPKRGDAVIITPPQHTRALAKRVIGISGDKIQIINGRVTLNGASLTYSQRGPLALEKLDGQEYPISLDPKLNFGPIAVPDKHVFVLGDNRIKSRDSRHWGPVPNVYVEGRISMIWMSVDQESGIRFSRVGNWLHQ